MDIIEIKKKLNANVNHIKKKFQVKEMSVLVSLPKGGHLYEDSDIDILVSFNKSSKIFNYMRLKYYLENLLGKVDW